LIEHPGNHRGDNTLANSVQILEDRPRHVRETIDRASAALPIDDVTVVGHSLGGYTALAVAGGAPWSLPEHGTPRPLDVAHDPRVRAVVLLAPALPWFMRAGSVANVHARVMVRVGERDELAPPIFIETVLRDLPKDYAVVPGAGHFAFFWPVPPPLLVFPPGQDPAGFDRAAYQPQLHDEVRAFLEREVPADDLR
jgi:pimeloyl-ACP methyl ester carboxylesterase